MESGGSNFWYLQIITDLSKTVDPDLLEYFDEAVISISQLDITGPIIKRYPSISEKESRDLSDLIRDKVSGLADESPVSITFHLPWIEKVVDNSKSEVEKHNPTVIGQRQRAPLPRADEVLQFNGEIAPKTYEFMHYLPGIAYDFRGNAYHFVSEQEGYIYESDGNISWPYAFYLPTGQLAYLDMEVHRYRVEEGQFYERPAIVFQDLKESMTARGLLQKRRKAIISGITSESKDHPLSPSHSTNDVNVEEERDSITSMDVAPEHPATRSDAPQDILATPEHDTSTESVVIRDVYEQERNTSSSDRQEVKSTKEEASQYTSKKKASRGRGRGKTFRE